MIALAVCDSLRCRPNVNAEVGNADSGLGGCERREVPSASLAPSRRRSASISPPPSTAHRQTSHRRTPSAMPAASLQATSPRAASRPTASDASRALPKKRRCTPAGSQSNETCDASPSASTPRFAGRRLGPHGIGMPDRSLTALLEWRSRTSERPRELRSELW